MTKLDQKNPFHENDEKSLGLTVKGLGSTVLSDCSGTVNMNSLGCDDTRSPLSWS